MTTGHNEFRTCEMIGKGVIMNKRIKQNLFLMIVGISLLAMLFHLSAVLGFFGNLFQLILPIVAGGILALFINVPVNGIEKWLNRRFEKVKKKPSNKTIHMMSFACAFVCIVLVFVLVLTLLIPEIARSLQSLYEQVQLHAPVWLANLNRYAGNAEWLNESLNKIDIENVTQKLSTGIDAMLTNVASALTSTVSMVVTAAFALIISIYIILGKERLCRHAKKLVCAYLRPKWAERMFNFCRIFTQSFTKFLSGQCTEALILGILMFLAFTIFKLPYGSLVGVLTAICAIIPYVGAFISCAVSVFLTLVINPAMAVRSLIVYLAVQFVENQFIYPRVVGSSVGLSPLYTLIAAMIGGKLFGILGIIFFIPLTAVLIEIIKENANNRLKNKNNMMVEHRNYCN